MTQINLNIFSYVQGALLHPDSEVVLGQGYAIPPFTLQRAGAAAAAVQSIHRPRQVKVVKTFSEFDDPDGWNPVKEKYNKNDFNDGDLKGKETVTGPPFGKNENVSVVSYFSFFRRHSRVKES